MKLRSPLFLLPLCLLSETSKTEMSEGDGTCQSGEVHIAKYTQELKWNVLLGTCPVVGKGMKLKSRVQAENSCGKGKLQNQTEGQNSEIKQEVKARRL